MCSTAEELLQLKSILKHFEFQVETSLLCDSVAARRQRRSARGKVRALAVRKLWLQDVVNSRALAVRSSSSKLNSAGLVTRVLPETRLRALRARIVDFFGHCRMDVWTRWSRLEPGTVLALRS